jgi:flavodoxin short chain
MKENFMRIAIIYWSSTGNTEMMAASIAEGARSNGAQVDLLPASQSDYLVLEKYDKFAFGCPPVGDEELDDTEFLPFYEQIEEGLANRKVALFGSYGWGDGLWMREWQERIKAKGALLFEEGLIIQEDSLPADDECRSFGERFALF